jgi:two-component system chemotaxis sensor kinase CheA
MVEEILEVESQSLVSAAFSVQAGPRARLLQRRGEAIPLLGLEAVLWERNMSGAASPHALVVNQSAGAIAFGVTRMLGQQEIVVRPIDDAMGRAIGVAGATDLGDGKPTLVLDLLSLGAVVARNMAP